MEESHYQKIHNQSGGPDSGETDPIIIQVEEGERRGKRSLLLSPRELTGERKKGSIQKKATSNYYFKKTDWLGGGGKAVQM